MSKSIDEILAVAEDPAFVRVATARIAFVRQALRDEHVEVSAQLDDVSKKRDTVDIPAEMQRLADRLLEIEAEMAAATIEFRFRGIGYRAWLDMLSKHPPTQPQLRATKGLDHNPETFPYAAMAATCVDPVMTADDAKRLQTAESIDAKSWQELWSACLRSNVADEDPKSPAAGLIALLNGASAKRPTNSESHAVSSSAG